MELFIKKPGLLTSVQDLGRWGFQSSGVPVSGSMNLIMLRLGNAMLGNPREAAGLDVTVFGPEIEVRGAGAAVFAGGDLGFSLNGTYVGSWRVVTLKNGDIISFSGMKYGCRGSLCFAGGIDVPLVMKSRSTYMPAKIGGFEGRALKSGDLLKTGEPNPLWSRLDSFTLPPELNPMPSPEEPLAVMCGLQEDAFTDEGKKTFFESEYTITPESNRMGYRLEGPKVEHNEKGADIVSDAVPIGAVQIPGNEMPIIMLADRQTTGGYTKIGVLSMLSIEALVQKLPGEKVRFRKAKISEGAAELRRVDDIVERVNKLRSSYESRIRTYSSPLPSKFRLTVNGKSYDITCEEI